MTGAGPVWVAPTGASEAPAAVRAILRQRGVRVTRVRESVLGALLQAGFPLSHRQLSASPDLGKLDRITLYRTLATLTNSGLVHQVQGVDGAWRYCAHTLAGEAMDPGAGGGGCPGNHAHLLCHDCGRMWCLSAQPLPHVDAPGHFRVEGKQMVVYGRCVECTEGLPAEGGER